VSFQEEKLTWNNGPFETLTQWRAALEPRVKEKWPLHSLIPKITEILNGPLKIS